MKALWKRCQTVRQVSSSSPAAEDLAQTEMRQSATSADCSADMLGVEAGYAMPQTYSFICDIIHVTTRGKERGRRKRNVRNIGSGLLRSL